MISIIGCNLLTLPHPDLVAQLVEQLTLNQWVESSSLSQVTTSKVVFSCRKATFFCVSKV